MVLEDGVQPDHAQVGVGEQAVRALGLWRPVRNAPRTEHLKGVEEHHAAPQVGERERRARVEPGLDDKLGRF